MTENQSAKTWTEFIQRYFSPRKNSAGFTLMEITLVLGLLALIGGLGLALSLDFYRTYNFNYEKNLLTALLMRARSQSLSNLNQTPHGVHIEAESYALFQGDSYIASDPAGNLAVPRNKNLVFSGRAEITFLPLSGEPGAVCDPSCDILMSDGVKSAVISINHEGRINQQ